MGMGLFRSTSKCVCGTVGCVTQHPGAGTTAGVAEIKAATATAKGAPNPYRFAIARSYALGTVCVIEAVYPDATNYEGRKVMVYAHALAVVMKQDRLDPHFCEGEACVSPVARFEPTTRGWDLAVDLVNVLGAP